MTITKESKKILNLRILDINEEITKIQSTLDPLIEKKVAYDAQITALQARLEKLKEEKTNINKDITASVNGPDK